MTFLFEDLLVYRKAIDYAVAAIEITRTFKRGYWFLADQLNRASVSISANIAEGNGRFTAPDRKQFFGVARGSIQECVAVLEIAARCRLIDAATHSALRIQLEELARMMPMSIAREFAGAPSLAMRFKHVAKNALDSCLKS